MPSVLVVAATELELGGHDGLACGVGPVEAAAVTAGRLAVDPPDRVLHVGLAGGHELEPGTLVVGTEALYVDLAAAIPVVARTDPDPALLATVQRALPDVRSLPIATSAAVGTAGSSVEAMEGFAVLRACALAGVPAVELRAISNELGEEDRGLWEIERALATLHAALPILVAALRE
jgi:nucleoside phosphorylase